MRDADFFHQIEHPEVHWRGKTVHIPLFYYDMTVINATFLTPLDRIRPHLPSPRMYPLRVTPWHGITSISAYEYRDNDIGPYNEVGVSFPITIGKPAPVFSGLWRKLPGPLQAYVHRLPVTTEIARDVGVEAAGYPKFLADITFENKDGSLHGSWSEGGRHVLTLAVDELDLQPVGRSRIHSITFREGRILRLEFIFNERRQGSSRNRAHAHLELGDHPMAQELRDLRLGRMVACSYTPKTQAILSPVLESIPG
jgi:hypothetical protein